MPILAVSPTVLSVEAWAALDEDTEGELVDRRLVEEEVASWAHEIVVSWLIHTLRVFFRPRGGFVIGSKAKLVIAADRGRKPDVLVFFGDRPLPPPRTSLCRQPPDIVVEVITATPRDQRRDRIDKKLDYATLRVGQYWLVDPEARTLEVLALDPDGRFVEILVAAEGHHEIPGVPGLHLDLDALWSELDQWAALQSDTPASSEGDPI